MTNTIHWLVTVRFDHEHISKHVKSALCEFPDNYAESHVRLDVMASVLNYGMKWVKSDKMTREQLADAVSNCLVILVTPLMRCKGWKRYTGKLRPRCKCQYCRTFYLLKNEAQIVRG